MIKCLRLFTIVWVMLVSNATFSQSVAQDKMGKLKFMVGEWIGTTTVLEEGVVTKKGSAFQRISYDLEGHLIVIELNSEFLQLLTVIYYDEEDKTYYYQPYSKNGSNRYKAIYQNGEFIVHPSDDYRFIFSSPANDHFREYGEQYKNGEWIKTFEDNFTNSK